MYIFFALSALSPFLFVAGVNSFIRYAKGTGNLTVFKIVGAVFVLMHFLMLL